MADASPDTIRILVSTDNHVGYAENDPVRGDDGWQTFDEILSLARTRDVDMVLLGGDLFHENKPSRKAMVHVMETLRKHCLGDKPCSLEMVGDESEHFTGAFNHANYLDSNINISIPVFSIHGNHDDPSGEGGFAALDELQMAGLLNYYGRVPATDQIDVKPLLLQKGTTKLALYGLSNVRDERLFRVFRDNKIKFFQPNLEQGEWYNILSVHQNHVEHTETSYLPESFLPSYMDMIIWGHEHECKIWPRENLEMGFEVMQPGSSIATALMPGEAVAKHVGILSITGKERSFEAIRLKTVRPFIIDDLSLSNNAAMKKAAKKTDNIDMVSNFCSAKVDKMIREAQREWLEVYQSENNDADPDIEPPLPLVRLRVDATPPTDGGDFKLPHTQRFSRNFSEQVANTTDIILFDKHKKSAALRSKVALAEAPELEDRVLNGVKMSKLISEYLLSQALGVLPPSLFGDAVNDFVDKSDKNAIGHFVEVSMKTVNDDLLGQGVNDEDADFEVRLQAGMTKIQKQQEERRKAGALRTRSNANLAPRPVDYDSDQDGHWADNPASITVVEDGQSAAVLPESDDDADGTARATTSTRGRGRGGRARGGTARGGATAAKKQPTKKAPAKKAPAKKTAARRQPFDEDSDSDVQMLDSDPIVVDDDDSAGLFVTQESQAPSRAQPRRQTTTRTNGTAARTQTVLNFGTQNAGRVTGRAAQPTSAATARPRRQEPSDEEIDSDDGAFEQVAPRR